MPGLLAVLLAATPMYYMNATYTWTKVLTAYFVILAVWFLRAGMRRQSRSRIVAAFGCLGAASMVHYSSGPYVLFLMAAYVVYARRRPVFREALLAAAAFLVLMAPWFAWSVSTHGASKTFASNSTVTHSALLTPEENVEKVLLNVVDTLVPRAWEPSASHGWFRRTTEQAFMWYQNNLLMAIGPVMGLLVAWGVTRGVRRPRGARARGELWFWGLFVAFTVVVGVAVHGERDTTGLAHICLQPLVYLGVVYVAAIVPSLGTAWRALLAVSVLVRFVVGVAFHVFFQHSVDSWARTPNWEWKVDAGLVFLGDWMAPGAPVIAAVLAVGAAAALLWGARALFGSPLDGWPVEPGRGDAPA